MLPVEITATPGAGLAMVFGVTIGDPDANVPDSYLWHFGDGTTSTSATPTCTYALAGTYTVDVAVVITPDAPGVVATHKRTRQITVGDSYVDTRGIPLTVSEEFSQRVAGGRTVTPAPVLSSLTPATAVHGAADAAVVCTGTGFQPGSVVKFGAVSKATTFISKTSISFIAPNLASPAGTTSVTVRNPDGRVSAGSNYVLS